MTSGSLPYRLRIVGKCRPDELFLLRSRIDARDERWAIVEERGFDANVFLYNLDHVAGQIAWGRRDDNASDTAHVAFSAGPAPDEAKVSIGKPLRGFQVETMLDEVEAALSGNDAPEQSAAPKKPKAAPIQPIGASARQPENSPDASANAPSNLSSLLHLLRSASGNEPMSIGLDTSAAILVSPGLGTAYSIDWGEMSSLARAAAATINCQSVSSADMEREARDRNLFRRRLDELLWFAALEGSEGHPLQEVEMDRRMQLKALPDFGRLYHRPTHVRIGVMMKYHALLPQEVAQRARASLPDVIDFYNACVCLDLLQVPTMRRSAK